VSDPDRRRQALLRALAPLALMALIFWLSSMSSDEEAKPLWEVMLRKLGHFGGYTALALLWFWALRRSAQSAIPIAVAISLVYAVSDEYHQTFVPGRTGTPIDVAIDAAGIAFAMLLIPRMQRAYSAPPAPREG
jgi:VanZ family protein